MNIIDNLLGDGYLAKIKKIIDLAVDCPLEVGQTYFFRCVTFHYVGTVRSIGLFEIVVDKPVWVADSGKWSEAYAGTPLADAMVAPPFMVIGRLSIVDAGPWTVKDTHETTRRG